MLFLSVRHYKQNASAENLPRSLIVIPATPTALAAISRASPPASRELVHHFLVERSFPHRVTAPQENDCPFNNPRSGLNRLEQCGNQ